MMFAKKECNKEVLLQERGYCYSGPDETGKSVRYHEVESQNLCQYYYPNWYDIMFPSNEQKFVR